MINVRDMTEMGRLETRDTHLNQSMPVLKEIVQLVEKINSLVDEDSIDETKKWLEVDLFALAIRMKMHSLIDLRLVELETFEPELNQLKIDDMIVKIIFCLDTIYKCKEVEVGVNFT